MDSHQILPSSKKTPHLSAMHLTLKRPYFDPLINQPTTDFLYFFLDVLKSSSPCSTAFTCAPLLSYVHNNNT